VAVHGRAHPVPAVISRGSLADAPVLITPAPVVRLAAPTPRWGTPGPPLISSAPFIAVLTAFSVGSLTAGTAFLATLTASDVAGVAVLLLGLLDEAGGELLDEAGNPILDESGG